MEAWDLFKQNNVPSDSRKANSDVFISGTYTNESYNMYSSISDNQKMKNKKSKAFAGILISLIAVSVVMFAYSIKNAFFENEEVETNDATETVRSIKTDSDFNNDMKVENITDEISALYNIPVGIKIVSINTVDNAHLNGLMANDIIVDISGTKVRSFEEANQIIETLQNDGVMISYKVYRNGAFKEIFPFE